MTRRDRPTPRRRAVRTPPADGPVLEAIEGARARIGPNGKVTRLMPRRQRRTVGAWCFLDHFGPREIRGEGMDVGAHPHCGLATVTWLLEGEAIHKDSLGSVQRIRPGQLNWMTAGHGISHSEESPEGASGRLHGVQLWVALPEATRHGAPAFDHHPELPHHREPGLDATVLVGRMGDAESPARADTPLVAADLQADDADAWVPLEPAFEHAVVVTEGALTVDGYALEPGTLLYLGTRRPALHVTGTGRALLIGGAPFDEPVLMGWNFVVRTPEELADAERSWDQDDGRFGTVDAYDGARIPLPRR